MCRKLAEASCSANEIAAISGHKSLPEVARYTKAADQKRMANSAMAAIENKTRVESDKPPSKVSQISSQVIEKKG